MCYILSNLNIGAEKKGISLYIGFWSVRVFPLSECKQTLHRVYNNSCMLE